MEVLTEGSTTFLSLETLSNLREALYGDAFRRHTDVVNEYQEKLDEFKLALEARLFDIIEAKVHLNEYGIVASMENIYSLYAYNAVEEPTFLRFLYWIRYVADITIDSQRRTVFFPSRIWRF